MFFNNNPRAVHGGYYLNTKPKSPNTNLIPSYSK